MIKLLRKNFSQKETTPEDAMQSPSSNSPGSIACSCEAFTGCVFNRSIIDGVSLKAYRSAFTLIELLVVITIMAILVGAALPYVQSYVQESRISKAKADLDEISKALAIYESREKTYTHTDVSQLTGRYLNKSPIDPWGKAYVVATSAGTVYSCGPDRIGDNEDDIIVNYIPPLALIQAYWVDANQTGAVDAQNTPDYLTLRFSRIVKTPVIQTTDFQITGSSTAQAAIYNWANIASLADGKTWILKLNNNVVHPFVAGSDTITVVDGNAILDLVDNKCIASQDVILRAQ